MVEAAEFQLVFPEEYEVVSVEEAVDVKVSDADAFSVFPCIFE